LNKELSSIREIRFSFLSPEEIKKRSVVHITESNFYDSSGEPRYNGLFDQRMGVIDRDKKCLTCKQNNVDCPGHFGHIEFAKPVYNLQFIKQIHLILRCVCNRCSKLLLSKDDPIIQQALKRKPEERLDFIKNRIKTTTSSKCGVYSNKKDKGVDEDNHGCGAEQPTKINSKDFNHVRVEYIREIKNEETGDIHKEPIEQPYTAEMVLNIFKRISLEDSKIMGFEPDWCLPHWLIYSVLPVVPPCVRPSIRMQSSQRSEDDITYQYNNIVKTNNVILEKIQTSKPADQIKDWIDLLQCHVSNLIDNSGKGVISESRHRAGRPYLSLKKRLHGKDGRIRNNLMGKRVDYSARTVISPDPSLDIDELGVPIQIAMNLTYPEKVNKYNINKLYKYVRNGSRKFPGANSYQSITDGFESSLEEFVDTSKIVLQYGDIVNRHLMDGDTVLFNRQPTLHKMGMMAHIVRVVPSKTFRFNVDVCKPYNADFDGDEMNMHVPQSIQTAMEIRHLAAVNKQIISPSGNRPIIKPSQDNLLGLYKITDDNVFFTYAEFMNLMTKVISFKGKYPEPAVVEGKKIRWTGKQAISMVLPPISIKDDKLIIDKGILLKGRIDGEMSGLIIHIIFSEYGFKETTRYMNDLQRVVKSYMVRSGFSIGMSDLIVHPDIRKRNEEIIVNTKKDVIDMTKQIHLNIFENISKDIEGVYEAKIRQRLSKASKQITEDTVATLNESNNRVKYMINSGSKGKPENIMQMMCLVDQQIISGMRVPLGFSGRSLPHFLKYDCGVESKGYVVNNFLQGLSPTEFFFHTMSGREGLIDTAVKTADSGYLQRKLIKTVEDLKVEHDYTVRNSNNKLVQLVYGNDAFDPIYLHTQSLDNLILPDDDMLNQYYINPNDKWDKYLDRRTLKAMKDNVNWKKKCIEYNKNFDSIVDKINNIHSIYAPINENVDRYRNVLFPINFNSILNNIKTIYKLDGKNKSDISPLEIVDIYEQLYEDCKFATNYKNPMFQVLITEFLAPSILVKKVKITRVALENMIIIIKNKYKQSLIQGGDCVGPVAAQSIGQLTTQMTLNTFHLAGVGSKSSVNQGMPRLKELLGQNKPKTPKLNIFLPDEYSGDIDKANQVCYNIELVKINDILKSDAIYFEPTNDLSGVLEEDREIMKLYEVFSDLDPQSTQIPSNPWLIRLEFNRHTMIDKKITMDDINLILKHHLPTSNIVYADDNSGKLIFRLRIDFDANQNNADDDILILHEQIDNIKNIIIKGISGIERASVQPNANRIVKEGGKYIAKKEYMIETDGSNLFDILTKSYIDATRTYSINVAEMYDTFGIEAAQSILEQELTNVFTMTGEYTNPRHIHLVCDVMTNRGTIMAANRNGINQSDNDIGPLAKSSFEETTEQLKMAGIYGQIDKLKGVSSNIMVGQIPKCGTGNSKILLDEDKLMEINGEETDYSHVKYDGVEVLNQLFDTSDYCAENSTIQFNIGAIEGDDIQLDGIAIPVEF
jgi:DNA-directed RNA polymerase II subunit RPB1